MAHNPLRYETKGLVWEMSYHFFGENKLKDKHHHIQQFCLFRAWDDENFDESLNF